MSNWNSWIFCFLSAAVLSFSASSVAASSMSMLASADAGGMGSAILGSASGRSDPSAPASLSVHKVAIIACPHKIVSKISNDCQVSRPGTLCTYQASTRSVLGPYSTAQWAETIELVDDHLQLLGWTGLQTRTALGEAQRCLHPLPTQTLLHGAFERPLSPPLRNSEAGSM